MTRLRIQAHSNNRGRRPHVTKVLARMRVFRLSMAILFAALTLSAGTVAAGPTTVSADTDTREKPAEALYLQLGQVGLDPERVYQVREASLDRSPVHITLEDGTIGFTQDVMGRITGAFFEGEGEVLVTPANQVERKSMSLFTGMAILEEHFATAYFRFNDEAAEELRPNLRVMEKRQEFVDRWNTTAKNLANADAIRLLMSFSRMLPVAGDGETPSAKIGSNDHYLHARLQGTKLGIFDVYFDSIAAEQVQAGQAKTLKDGSVYYDVWTSFSLPEMTASEVTSKAALKPVEERRKDDRIAVRSYVIKTEVHPPTDLRVRARAEVEIKDDGERVLMFELSRYLQVESVKLDGKEVEFIHNPAVEGTQLSRQGNDVVAVMLPQPSKAGQKIDLEFVYGGEVMAEAGGGLLYVGARGTWYPNRGMAMADFDLEFEYPQGWTLVATGKPSPLSAEGEAAKAKGEQASRWISERPLPLAGFNLGKYRMATAKAGDVEVQAYATQGVERSFPGSIELMEPKASDMAPQLPQLGVTEHPSPVRNEMAVAESAARAIEYYAKRFGPYPYSHLALTQMPGRDSQGWPGLVFLSSYAFLDQREREQLHYEPYRILLQQEIPAHETAHQWWGDLILWNSYRDQWFTEGLANYCALMMLQERNPAGFREVMDKYRKDLITPNKDGMAPVDAGPVTLGGRLESSRFPEGYEAISYGRSTWLFHMLRSMMRDAQPPEEHKPGNLDEPFIRALRNMRNRYEGKSITTREMFETFAKELPSAARYEGQKSLDWFVEGWINGTAVPKIEVKSVKIVPREKGTMVSGTIVQDSAPEDLVTSVPVYGVSLGKAPIFLGRVFADGEETTFRLSAPAGVRKVVLDAEQTVLTNTK